MGNSPNHNNNNNNNRQRLGNIINRVFESAGPDGKVRGTPQQIIDKYQALARDAQLAGDRVAAESFLQHSEHYSRMLGEAQAQAQEQRQTFDRDDGPREDGRRDEGARRDDDTRRDEGGRRDDEGGRREGGFDQPRQPAPARPESQQQPQQQPQREPALSSGLAMIDPAEDGEFGGLIDTPESQAAAPPRPAPADAAPNGVNGARHAAADAPAQPAQEEPVREAPKRGRPRRKAPRPDGDPAASQPE